MKMALLTAIFIFSYTICVLVNESKCIDAEKFYVVFVVRDGMPYMRG